MDTKVHFSSKTDEWATPIDFFAEVISEFGLFDLDPCCTAESAKAPRYFTKETDGLNRHWSGKVWMNPPYGRTIGAWMKKAYESSLSLRIQWLSVWCLPEQIQRGGMNTL